MKILNNLFLKHIIIIKKKKKIMDSQQSLLYSPLIIVIFITILPTFITISCFLFALHYKHIDLNHHFPGIFQKEYMVTAFDVKYGKPNPEPYLMGLKKAGIDANEAVVVENAPLGVKAGVAAGIFTIAVNTGPLPNSALLDEGANLLFSSMQELSDKWNVLRNDLLKD